MNDDLFTAELRQSDLILDRERLEIIQQRFFPLPPGKDPLQPSTQETPPDVTHHHAPSQKVRRPHLRDTQITELVRALGPALSGHPPNHITIHGPAGSGKTATVSFVLDRLQKKCRELDKETTTRDLNIDAVWIDCDHIDTEYRVLQHTLNQYARHWKERVPYTGIATHLLVDKLISHLEERGRLLVLVLDNAHALNALGIYETLLTINNRLSRGRLAVLTVTRRLNLFDQIPAELRQPLLKELVAFNAFTPGDLETIVTTRAQETLKPGAITDAALMLIAAQGVNTTGGATRSLEFLRDTAIHAETHGAQVIEPSHVMTTYHRLEEHRLVHVLSNLTVQARILVFALASESTDGRTVNSGNLYNAYSRVAGQLHIAPVTERRLCAILNKMVNADVIEATEINGGRNGRTRAFRLVARPDAVYRLFNDDPVFRALVHDDPEARITYTTGQGGIPQ